MIDDPTLPSPARPPEEPDHLVTVDPAHYRLEHELARGGMGRVRLAHDHRLGRPVAIKELLDQGPEARRRFQLEARLTARLQHPSIINVHEAGVWPTGEPFFAMALIAGRSLGEVVQQSKTVESRLALLPHVLAASDAIAYAHDRGVVHRDLKPANVLVGDYGETVVIDWGVAKQAHDGEARPDSLPPEATQPGAIVGTPASMAPEQARGDAVDERTDVYALGAMLDHLLSGRPAYDGGPWDVVAAVRAGPPTPLSSRQPGLPRELLAIVERAMAREPAARYANARAFAADLRRFQSGQLVGAHHYSLGELLVRWVRRNRAAVVVAAVASLTLAVVGVTSVRRVVAAQARAEASRDDAEALLGFMLGDLHDRLEPLGRLDVMEALASRAGDYFAHNPTSTGTDDRRRRAATQRALGEVASGLGRSAAAIEAGRQAVMLLEPLADAASRTELGRALHSLGSSLLAAGAATEAQQVFERELTLREQLAHDDPSPTRRHDLEAAHVALGDVAFTMRRHDDALAIYDAALSRLGGVAGEDELVSRVESNLGHVLTFAHRRAEARAHEVRALEVSRRLAKVAPPSLEAQRRVASALENLAGADPSDPAALAQYTEALALRRAVEARDPSNVAAINSRALAELQLGDLLREHRRFAEALPLLEDAHTARAELVARDPQNPEARRALVVVLHFLGDVRVQSHDAAGALGDFEQSVTLARALRGEPISDPEGLDVELGSALLGWADALDQLERTDAAVAKYREAREAIGRYEQTSRGVTLHLLTTIDDALGERAQAAGDHEGARAAFERELVVMQRLATLEPTDDRQGELAATHAQLGNALLLGGHVPQALTQATAACAWLDAHPSDDADEFDALVQCHQTRAMAWRTQGDPRARAERAQALTLARKRLARTPDDAAAQKAVKALER